MFVPSAHPLDAGDTIPDLALTVTTGEVVRVPEYFRGSWGILLYYRGAWCSYCRRQLQDFNDAYDELRELGAKIVAASADTLAEAAVLAGRHRLQFPVAYGVDVAQAARTLGCFIHGDGEYCQPCAFVLSPAPAQRIVAAAYATGPAGRLTADDCKRLVAYLSSEENATLNPSIHRQS